MRPSQLQKLAHSFFADSAEHHLRLSKAHLAHAEALAEDESAADSPGLAFHKECADAHAGYAEKCLAMAKNLDPALKVFKAAGMDDDEVLPSPVSRVAPEPSGLRMVPRTGSPQIAEKADVPQEFLRLVAIEEEL